MTFDIQLFSLAVVCVTQAAFLLHFSTFLHLLSLPVCVCVTHPSFHSHSPPAPVGRVSLSQGASLLVERLILEDEGWFECRILVLDTDKDEFQNGTWTFLSITGAALQGYGGSHSFGTAPR